MFTIGEHLGNLGVAKEDSRPKDAGILWCIQNDEDLLMDESERAGTGRLNAGFRTSPRKRSPYSLDWMPGQFLQPEGTERLQLLFGYEGGLEGGEEQRPELGLVPVLAGGVA
jgi:hypothetical protein